MADPPLQANESTLDYTRVYICDGEGKQDRKDLCRQGDKHERSITAGLVQSDAWIVKSAIPVVPLHKVPPPKESMKEVEENRA
jgi:hypothetical protein